MCLATHPKETLLCSGSDDHTARIWDLRLDPVKSIKCLMGFPDSVNSVAFGCDGDHLVYAACGKKIFCYDLRKEEVLLKNWEREYDFNEEEVNQICCRKTFLAACDDSGEIKILNTDSYTLYKTLRRQHSNICSAVKFHPVKPWEVFSGALDSSLVHWDFSRAKPLHHYNLAVSSPNSPQIVNPPFVHSIDVSMDGNRMAVGLGDFTVRVYNPQTQTLLHHLEFHTDVISQVLFPHFDPNYLLAGSNDSWISLWKLPPYQGSAKPKKGKKTGTSSSVQVENGIAENLLKLHHGSKVNWMATTSSNSIFVADTSHIITQYQLD